MTQRITVAAIEAAEERLSQQLSEYLRQRDWELLSGDEDVSDQVWLWRKKLPAGRQLLMLQEQAIQLEQELWPEEEDEGQPVPEIGVDDRPEFELLPPLTGESWQQLTSKMYQLLVEADMLYASYGLVAQPEYVNPGAWIEEVRDTIGAIEAVQAAAAALPG